MGLNKRIGILEFVKLVCVGFVIYWSLLLSGCSKLSEQSPSPIVETNTPASMEKETSYLNAREKMVSNTIEARGVKDPAVLAAMRSVPRHEFVPSDYLASAYADHPLPIGYGQTISQPYIVARMTEAVIEKDTPKNVLEVGTGSGYQTAVIAQLVEKVFSVERIKPLLYAARRRFQELNLRNIRVNHSDGSWGWPEYAPYEAIIVTAAPVEIPQTLLDQLDVGGRLVAPIGPKGNQKLVLITRTESEFQREILNQVSFVPLLGGVE